MEKSQVNGSPKIKVLFVRRLCDFIESRVFVEAEIHELRCIALADGSRSIRLLDLFKFEINFSILMDGSQQVTINLGARFFCARRIWRQRITYRAGSPHDPARQFAAVGGPIFRIENAVS